MGYNFKILKKVIGSYGLWLMKENLILDKWELN